MGKDLYIDLLDLCEVVGGMYNAVEILMELKETYKVLYKRPYYEYQVCEIIKHHEPIGKIEDAPEDRESIYIKTNNRHGGECWSYGYLKEREIKLSFKFIDVDNNNMKDIIEKLKDIEEKKIKSKKEMGEKYKDIDPYGEEDWISESRRIKKYKNFILEDLNFNFDKDEWEDIDRIKIDTRQRRAEFLEYEVEFFNKLGFNLVTETRMEERTPYYVISLVKRMTFTPKIRGYSEDRKIDPYVFNYYFSLENPPGNCTWRKNTDNLNPGSTMEERRNSIKRIMKELYLHMWENKLDPDAIIKKEKSALKHKDNDPYGEEQWDEDDK